RGPKVDHPTDAERFHRIELWKRVIGKYNVGLVVSKCIDEGLTFINALAFKINAAFLQRPSDQSRVLLHVLQHEYLESPIHTAYVDGEYVLLSHFTRGTGRESRNSSGSIVRQNGLIPNHATAEMLF